MSRVVLSAESRVQLARHARLRLDTVRGRWTLLVPEKVMTPDAICVEILQLCDGKTSVEAVSKLMEDKYEAAPGVIAREVLELLQDLSDRGFLVGGTVPA